VSFGRSIHTKLGGSSATYTVPDLVHGTENLVPKWYTGSARSVRVPVGFGNALAKFSEEDRKQPTFIDLTPIVTWPVNLLPTC
jgi:hypothetical protein